MKFDFKFDFSRLFKRKEKTPPEPAPIALPEGGPFLLSESGKSLFFGRYPQSVALVDDEMISNKPNEDGYLTIIGDGSPVVYATALESFIASCGKAIEKGVKNSYRFDPIEWDILRYDEKEALLISSKILDAKPYNDLDATRDGNRKDAYGYSVRLALSDQGNVPANNWEVSTLREWLNWDFLATCFKEEELEFILPTDPSESIIKGETFSDDVRLLSLAEAQDPALGYAPASEKDEKRKAASTDYAKASGLVSENPTFGVWWVKDGGFTTYNAARVYHDGYLNETGKKVDQIFGVRPVIKIKL